VANVTYWPKINDNFYVIGDCGDPLPNRHVICAKCAAHTICIVCRRGLRKCKFIQCNNICEVCYTKRSASNVSGYLYFNPSHMHTASGVVVKKVVGILWLNIILRVSGVGNECAKRTKCLSKCHWGIYGVWYGATF